MTLNLEEWIQEQSPITPKLFTVTGEASLEVLKESWRSVSSLERRWLQKASLTGCETVFAREIAMHSNHHIAWYAKTLIPQSTFEKNAALFARLATEPLGQILFNEPGVERRFFLSYKLNPSKSYRVSLWVREAGLEDALPAIGFRISLFTIRGDDPLVLFEVYLDGLRKII